MDVAAHRGARITARMALVTGPFLIAIIVLSILRFVAPGPLWLDEVLSVNIARLPIPQLLDALRHDGSPPLYYLLLHGWMAVFGEGTFAVRCLSGVLSLLALPVAGIIGHRLGGRPAAGAAVVLLAACPFAIRYGSETRMYALVMLLALLGTWAAIAAWKTGRIGPLIALAVVSGALALTHYWTLFLLVTAELWLVYRIIRRRSPGAWRLAVAIPAGGILFLPWTGSFLYQVQNTGTPWASVPGWDRIPVILLDWAGPGWWGIGLALVWLALVIRSCVIPAGRDLTIVALGSVVVGIGAVQLVQSGVATRYTAPMVALTMLAAAVGVSRLRRWLRITVLAAAVVIALVVTTWSPLLGLRTQAADTAALLRDRVHPGDLVVYCPDQLGPAVSRLLPSDIDQVTYPTLGSPRLIDWVHYAARNAAADPAALAARLDRRTQGRIWLVHADGYRTYGDQCTRLDSDLAHLRGGRAVLQEPSAPHEPEGLISFPAR